MKKAWILVVLAVGLAVSAMAEFRVWTDKKGNVMEAELTGTEGKNIVLKKRDGKSIALSPLTLSEEDQNFLKGKIPDGLFDSTVVALDLEKPPRLEIGFKKITDTDNNAEYSSYRDVDMVGCVTITKKNREPYSGKLKAAMYVIGFHSDEGCHVVLDIQTHDFDLTQGSEISFSGTHFTIREYKYNAKYSTQYDGYLVVITDEKGEVMAIKSNSKRWTENHQKLAEQKKGVYFDKNFKKKADVYGDVTY